MRARSLNSKGKVTSACKYSTDLQLPRRDFFCSHLISSGAGARQTFTQPRVVAGCHVCAYVCLCVCWLLPSLNNYNNLRDGNYEHRRQFSIQRFICFANHIHFVKKKQANIFRRNRKNMGSACQCSEASPGLVPAVPTQSNTGRRREE